jgi:UDP-3-O-[3-hydroxymyristoyl] glucosamine N-acyltransferase
LNGLEKSAAMQNPKSLTVAEIAAMVGVAAPAGSENIRIAGVANLAEAGPGDLSFLSSSAYWKQFSETKAGAVLVQKDVKTRAAPKSAVIIVDDADLAMNVVLQAFALPVPRPPIGVDPLSRVDSTAQIGAEVRIAPFCFVGKNVRLGRGTILHPHVYIADDVAIGEDCEIFPSVTVRERITVGNRVIIHSGSVLGSDGFGYRWDGSKHAKVPQIGTVVIEDDVEIGSCVCIDRAKFSVTLVGKGTKIDNLVQIAHNVTIGPHCIIVGQVGIAGSANIGAGAILGGQVAVRDHANVGERAMVAACSVISSDIPAQAVVSGVPALPHRQHLREQAAMRRLPDLVVQVRQLREALDQLQKQFGPPSPQ